MLRTLEDFSLEIGCSNWQCVGQGLYASVGTRGMALVAHKGAGLYKARVLQLFT
jgi:hypothetical protein